MDGLSNFSILNYNFIMLEVKNLKKTFIKKDQKTKEKSEVGVFDISFNATEGKVFGLIGANGAGKTTTMRILADLTSPHSGEILLDRKHYSETKDIKSMLGFVSGETQIFDRLTPIEILTLFAEVAGLSKTEITNRISMLIEKLGMKEFAHLPAGKFSTGMKQKVSIARALVTDAKVLIFDEVTNGLDIFASRAVKEIIKDLKKEGKIIVYSTHIMPDADELCDEVLIIHKGREVVKGELNKLKIDDKVKNLEELFFKKINEIDPEADLS